MGLSHSCKSSEKKQSFFLDYLVKKKIWKVEIVSTSGAEGRFVS